MEAYQTRPIGLQEVYRAAFGYMGLPYVLLPDPQQVATGAAYEQPGQRSLPEAEDYTSGSVLQVRQAETYQVPVSAITGMAFYMPVSLGGNQLPNEPMVTVRLEKRIVRTELAGTKARGSVKEMVGYKDPIISIQGVAIGPDPDVWPEAQIRMLNNLFKLDASVPVVCRMLNQLGIQQAIIERLSIDPMPGWPGMVPYTMELVADTGFSYQYLTP